MNRRTALKVLGVGTIACFAGKKVYAQTNEFKWTWQTERITWDMDDIKIVELRYQNEIIEIDTKDIFEALKEDYGHCVKPKKGDKWTK